MRRKMKSKCLFALAIIAVFLTVSLVPVLAQPYTVTVIIRDPSHTHGAVILTQEGGARSHVFELSAQTQLDADTWIVSIPLTTDIPPNVAWSISLPITVGVYDLRDMHYNIYRYYYLQGDFTGTFEVCYSPDVPIGGLCPVGIAHVPTQICVIQLGVGQPDGTVIWWPGYAYPDLPASQCPEKTEYYTDVLGRTIVIHQFNQTRIIPIASAIILVA